MVVGSNKDKFNKPVHSGGIVDKILEADGNYYLGINHYNYYVSKHIPVWRYLSQLDQGTWGAPVLLPSQELYHDLSGLEKRVGLYKNTRKVAKLF